MDHQQERPKRRHHHVWQHYLKSWTVDGKIWCLQNGKIFPTGTTMVAVERDFYKLERLKPSDRDFIQNFFAVSHPAAQQNFTRLLDLVDAPFRFADKARNEFNREAIDKKLSFYASSVLEDYHATIEASFLPILASALAGDISFYDDKRCILFLNFISTQYMRTKGIKERAIALFSSNNYQDLNRVWNVMIHMFAANIGADLYRERRRRRLVLIKNDTNVPFITGDQPAINLKAIPDHPPENLSIYYPISPKLALVLADIDDASPFPEVGLTREQALILNRLVGDASYLQVFAKESELLRTVFSPKP